MSHFSYFVTNILKIVHQWRWKVGLCTCGTCSGLWLWSWQDWPVNMSTMSKVFLCAVQGLGMTLKNVGSLLEPFIVFMWLVSKMDFTMSCVTNAMPFLWMKEIMGDVSHSGSPLLLTAGSLQTELTFINTSERIRNDLAGYVLGPCGQLLPCNVCKIQTYLVSTNFLFDLQNYGHHHGINLSFSTIQ